MKNEYLKTLWTLRFEKIKVGEDDAAWKYQEILDQCLPEFGRDAEITTLLGQLVHEERFHKKLAEDLIKICHRNHPEITVLGA